MASSENRLAVGLHAGNKPRPRAGSQDDVRRFERLHAVLRGDRDGSGGGEPSRAPQHVNGMALHEEFHALDQARGDFAAALDGGGVVQGHILRREAEFLAAAGDQAGDFGVTQERLGGDTAPIQAHAAQMLTLHHSGLQAQLRGADRGHVAAGASAEDHHVIGWGHRQLLGK